MRPRSRGAATAAGLALAAVLVAGCGDDGARAATSSSPTPTVPSTPTAAPTPTRTASATPAPRQPTVSISVPAELRTSAPDREVLGADMSWPQCPPGTGIPQKRGLGAPYPLPSARYVVLGLTNGPGFTPNPCLSEQVAYVKQRHLEAAAYSVLSFPRGRLLARAGGQGPYDASTRAGRLSNAGYSQALYNVATMKRAGLTTPMVWLDVEPVPKFDWPRNTAANAAVVVGAAKGYRDRGYGIGVYSTQSLWQRVVGDLRLGLPEWRAAGLTSRAEARARCGRGWSFQGGTAILSQWLENSRDQNITCPGTTVRMAIWFHQY